MIILSIAGFGSLSDADPWNEFDIIVQDFGWGEEQMVFPLSNPSVELRLIQSPITNPPEVRINSCIFHTDNDIDAGIGVTGTAICKLLDDNGRAIAEGRTNFDFYTGSDDLEILINFFSFPNSNLEQNVFDIFFIIEAPV